MSTTASPGTPATLTPEKPPAAKPLYPDTPWWASLVAVLVTAVVSVVGTVMVMKGGIGDVGVPSAAAILIDTVTYIPHIILLFGVLADMFTYEGVYSIPSLVGILSIFGNYIFRFFWIGVNSLIGSAKRAVGATPTAPPQGARRGGDRWFTTYDGCNVQGFESFGSRFAPQTLVVTATVFSYYIFDLVKNRGVTNALGAIITGATLFIIETIIIGNCQPQGVEAGRDDEPGMFGKAIRALAEGLFFGGASFGIVQTYYPDRLPSKVISPFPKRSKSDLTTGPDGKLYDKDGYPWVVLPNGQTYPDLSTAQSRRAFNEVASLQLGTGRPAAQACNA